MTGVPFPKHRRNFRRFMLGENGCFVVRVTLSIWSKTIFRCGIICFFFKHIYFAASGQAVVTGVVPFPPPLVLAFKFYRAQGSAIPLLVDFSSSVVNSRSRAFRKSVYAQEKVPTNLYEYALGEIRAHETDLYQARG